MLADASCDWKVKDAAADTRCTLLGKSGTPSLPSDLQLADNSFSNGLFFPPSEGDKLTPLASKQSALLFSHLHQWGGGGQKVVRMGGGSERHCKELEIHLPHRAAL